MNLFCSYKFMIGLCRIFFFFFFIYSSIISDNQLIIVVYNRLAFCEELAQPQAEAEELVAMTLLGMVTRFCNSSAPHFPIRKVLLLLWKVLLCSLGGTQVLAQLKS